MDTEMNQLDNQEFGFGDLDSLQEQVALKNSTQKSETEPEWELTEEDAREIKESLGDNLDLLDMFDEQTKRENELSQEWDNKESKEYKFLEKLKPDEIQRIKRRVQEKIQEEIELKYSLAKMKQDLDFNSQSQEEKQEVDLTYPAQKREFLNETLEVVDKGITPNIKESLGILDRIDEVESQIDKKEKEINAEQEKDSSSPSKTILDSEIDEALQKQQQEQQELHQKELKSLQTEKEALEKNFQASIENLIKQGDVKDLLKNLQTLDEAFAKFLKKTKEECDLLAKQRIETLELAMQSESVKVVVSGFVKELHNNRKEVKEQSKELESQKECFEALQKQQQKCLKGDEKSMSEARFDLERNLVWLNENHPTFKDNYPKFYKELEQTLKEPQKQQEKQQENTRQRSA